MLAEAEAQGTWRPTLGSCATTQIFWSKMANDVKSVYRILKYGFWMIDWFKLELGRYTGQAEGVAGFHHRLTSDMPCCHMRSKTGE